MALSDREFTDLFQEVYPGLCRFLECLIGRSGSAQEIAQESFLRLLRNGFHIAPRAEIKFWLYRVARNLALNELGRRKMQRKFRNFVSGLLHSRTPMPGEDLDRSERNCELMRMLELLPEHQRAALLLREQEMMGYAEIAQVLNISESKVKGDIFRARCRLREERELKECDCVAKSRY